MRDSSGDHSQAHPQAQTMRWRDFGPFLQRVRRRRGISQATLAAHIGCGRTYIWRLEKGRNRPSRMLLNSLALAYPLTAEETVLLCVFRQMQAYGMDELERA